MQNGKPWWQSWKFIVSMLVTVLLFASVLTLAILGKVTVTSEQIIDFGEWLLMLLIGGHSAQRISYAISEALASRGGELLPPPGPTDEQTPSGPAEEEDDDAQ